MDQEDQLHEIFQRYIQNECTPEEVRFLINKFRLKSSEKEALRRSIKLCLEEPEGLDRVQVSKMVQKGLNNLLTNIENRSKGNVIQINRKLIVKIAIAASVFLTINWVVFKWDTLPHWLNMQHSYQISTQIAERKFFKLTDGTKVWLSPASTLNYPHSFTGNTREISLDGEAFFEVAKDHLHPFIIHTDKVNTKVLGTSFDLKSYSSDKKITVTLLEGKVSFSNGKENIMLIPNQRATFFKNDEQFKKEDYLNAAELLDRRTGNYTFKGVSVNEVIEDLMRAYKIKINVSGAVSTCLFFGRIKKSENPDVFLHRLCHVVNARLIKENNNYMITGGGCQ